LTIHRRWLTGVFAAAMTLATGGMAEASAAETGSSRAQPDVDAQKPAMEAQGSPASPIFEVTPFAGYRFGGSFRTFDTGEHVDLDSHGSFAVALDLQADAASQYELFYGRQASSVGGTSSGASSSATVAPAHVTVEYLHIGGSAVLDDSRRFMPYILGG